MTDVEIYNSMAKTAARDYAALQRRQEELSTCEAAGNMDRYYALASEVQFWQNQLEDKVQFISNTFAVDPQVVRKNVKAFAKTINL